MYQLKLEPEGWQNDQYGISAMLSACIPYEARACLLYNCVMPREVYLTCDITLFPHILNYINVIVRVMSTLWWPSVYYHVGYAWQKQ